MKTLGLFLTLFVAALCSQPSAKAYDGDDYYWYHRHHRWHHGDYDDNWRERRAYWRQRHYEEWQERRAYWHHRRHHTVIQAGPVLIER